ncbi:MAG: SRPBCC domain-containing protein [Solirubrobacterales bacterium]|nr:SRPBCC domain-containing protein [Solirubrobacterales bacterium]MBV9425777.1 SRPBCC domain-containing protein [Solirubrobacterales bacterium]
MTDRIARELSLPAPPADVWDAVTDPDLLQQWLADEVILDLRPGGDAWFRVGEDTRSGWVEEVSPPGGEPGSVEGRLVFWWAEGDEPASRVELAIAPLEDGGTRLRVSEARPLDVLDLVGIPLSGAGGSRLGPALVAA